MRLLTRLLELEKNNKEYVLATVVKASGSVPGKPGFRMLIESDEKTIGTVGGGAIEKKAIDTAIELLGSGTGTLKEYELTKEGSEKEGVEKVPMMCSGKVWIFFDVKHGKTPLYIFGGGHVGSALTHLASILPFHITLIDNRKEFASPEKCPGADAYVCDDYVSYTSSFSPPQDAYYVVLTHGHEYDYDIAKNILGRTLSLSYLGIIASRAKSKKMREQLETELGDKAALDKLHSPIGLKIGGDTAEEIALAIAAQIQSVKFEHHEKK